MTHHIGSQKKIHVVEAGPGWLDYRKGAQGWDRVGEQGCEGSRSDCGFWGTPKMKGLRCIPLGREDSHKLSPTAHVLP